MKGGLAMRAMATVAVLAAGVACVPALNAAGGIAAKALGLPAGGHPRLAWDLGWLLLSVFAAAWLPARWSPLWPRGLALGLTIVLIASACWAAYRLGADFPQWFVACVLIGVPVAAGAALALARRGLRARHRQA